MSLKPIYVACSVIVTIFGLFLIPYRIAEATGNHIWGGVAAALISLILTVCLLMVLYRPLLLLRFGIPHNRNLPIIMENRRHINVNKSFHATIEDHRTFLFTSKASEADLAEFIDYLPDQESKDHEVEITEAKVKRIVRKSTNRFAVIWEPAYAVPLFTPYEHCFIHRPSSIYGDDAFYHAMHFDRPVGMFSVEITLPQPVSRCVATCLHRFQHGVTYRLIYRHLFKRPLQACAQPELKNGRMTLTWSIVNPPLYSTYVIFACYNGMEEVARKYLLDRMIPRSLFRRRKGD